MSLINIQPKAAAAALNDLLSAEDPNTWKDWISHIQAQLILQGYTMNLTKKGTELFAERFNSLQEFFSDLREGQK